MVWRMAADGLGGVWNRPLEVGAMLEGVLEEVQEGWAEVGVQPGGWVERLVTGLAALGAP